MKGIVSAEDFLPGFGWGLTRVWVSSVRAKESFRAFGQIQCTCPYVFRHKPCTRTHGVLIDPSSSQRTTRNPVCGVMTMDHAKQLLFHLVTLKEMGLFCRIAISPWFPERQRGVALSLGSSQVTRVLDLQLCGSVPEPKATSRYFCLPF